MATKTTQSLDRKREAMTKAFIEAVETAGKWLPDWIDEAPMNFLKGSRYHGINAVMLPVHQFIGGFKSCRYAPKGQIKAAGGRVRDGEMVNGTWVFFWGRHEKKTIDRNTGEEEKKTFWFPKAYQVWNLDQVEGIDEAKIKGTPNVAGAELDEAAEALLGRYCEAEGIKIIGGRPSYSPRMDCIALPPRASYQTTEGYYNSWAHEAGHSTGHAGRLARDIENVFGDHLYSREELVAQLSAAFIRADIGMSTEAGQERDAAYLSSWLSALRADPSMLFDAAQDADKAVKFIREKAGVEAQAEA